MRRLIVLILAVFGAMGSSASAAPPDDGVLVVGHGTVGSGVGALDVDVTAISAPGGVHGRYVVQGEFTHVVRVECIRVVGDHVVVGGHISWSSNPTVIGRTGLIEIRDDAAGDSIGIAFSTTDLDSCPDIAPPAIPVTSGDFSVHPLHLGPPD